MSNEFYEGMIAYEQKCEQLLDKLSISEEYKIYIQTKVLDTAQRMIEEEYLLS